MFGLGELKSVMRQLLSTLKPILQTEISEFVRQSHEFFELLCDFPEMLASTKTQKNIRRGLINRHVLVAYRIKPRKKQIELLNIRGSRQKPVI